MNGAGDVGGEVEAYPLSSPTVPLQAASVHELMALLVNSKRKDVRDLTTGQFE
jgi:hypothetical protein